MIRCKNIFFTYSDEQFSLEIPTLTIGADERVALIGPSGGGKTTLLHLLAGIQKPTSGSILMEGIDLVRYSQAERRDFRIIKMGLVFQEFELLEYLNLFENVMLPFRINEVLERYDGAEDQAENLLDQVGLSGKRKRYPNQLSQGERQRIAVCRALITRPQILLCDEPTGNLDPVNRDKVLEMLFNYCYTNYKPMVMVTHDLELLAEFSRTINIQDFKKNLIRH